MNAQRLQTTLVTAALALALAGCAGAAPATPAPAAPAPATAAPTMAPPPTAQTPQQSARRILAQAAKNRRVIFGDDPDEAGAKNCFHPDHEDIPDTYLLEVARARRSGESTRV